jgi:hypothetical protein
MEDDFECKITPQLRNMSAYETWFYVLVLYS